MKKKIILYFICILIISVVSVLIGYNICNEKIKIKDDKIEENYSYLLFYSLDEKEEIVDFKAIFTFDKNDICIDCRVMYEFKDEDFAKSQYNNYINIHKNVKIDFTKVTFNSNNENGKSKKEIMKNTPMNYIEM